MPAIMLQTAFWLAFKSSPNTWHEKQSPFHDV
jgi:hypothetical protein